MKGARILQFGPPSVITIDDLPRPEPVPGQLLVRVSAAGVGYWDTLSPRRQDSRSRRILTSYFGVRAIRNRRGNRTRSFRFFKVGDEVYGDQRVGGPTYTQRQQCRGSALGAAHDSGGLSFLGRL